MKSFVVKLVKDVATVFVVTSAGLLVVPGTGFGKAELIAAAVAGLKAVLGVLVKDIGEENTPHL
jgi:hypothetical protein